MSTAQTFDYSARLDKLRSDFLAKWSVQRVSESIGLEKYYILCNLGHGSFGNVFLVREKTAHRYYAVKQLKMEYIVKMKQVAHVFGEKRVLTALRFPNTVFLITSYKDMENLYLVLPFIPGGELFTYLRKIRRFTEKQARFYAGQVVLALEYLHHCQLIYRDLKPENILIDHRGYIKLTDFGFTKRVTTRTTTLCGTPEYLAPEMIQSKPYGHSVDWWAFGVLVYELVVGQSPFSQYNRDVMVMYRKICDGDFKLPASFSPALKSLILRLLQTDTSKRLGSGINGPRNVKEDMWFAGVDWQALYNQEFLPPYAPILCSVENLTNADQEQYCRPMKSKGRYYSLFESF